MRLFFSVFVLCLGFVSFEAIAEKNIVCRSNETKIRGMRLPAGYTSNIKSLSNRIRVISFSDNNTPKESLVKKLQKKNERVLGLNVTCSKDSEIKLSGSVNDPHYSLQSNLSVIQSPSSWDLSTGNRSVKVAVIDTGILYTHPDLAANMMVNTGEIASNGLDDDGNGVIDDIYGANYISNNGNPLDDHGHGTHCAGIIGAVGGNGTGITGVNHAVSLLGVKGLNASGSGSTSAIAAGVDYARRRGVDVMNLSLGSPSDSSVLKNALKQASDAGIILVFAAGNENTNNDVIPSYPAAYNFTNSITVAATNNSDALAAFSNYGASTTHLAAPGVDIPSTYLSNQYVYMSGTSMAAPHVAGVAGLVKAYSPSKSGTEIKQCIINNVDSVSGLSGKVSTGGRLNAYKALLCERSAAQPTPDPGNEGGGGGGGGGADPEPSNPVVVIDYSIKASRSGSSGIQIKGEGLTLFNNENVPDISIYVDCMVSQKSKRIKGFSTSAVSGSDGAFRLNIKTRLNPAIFRSNKEIVVDCDAYADENDSLPYPTSAKFKVTRRR